MKFAPFVLLILAVISFVGRKWRQSRPHPTSQSEAAPADMDDRAVRSSALHHRDWQVRAQAVKALGERRSIDAIPDMAAKLKDEDHDVREAARQALEMMGSPAVPALLEMLQDGDVQARALAARALGALGDVSARDGLVEALADKSLWVRAPAAESLGSLRDASAVPALVNALRDPEAEVQQAAAAALRQIGTAEALAALKR